MTDYNTIAETKHFIVLDRYERDMVLNEEYQSEDALEREFMTRGKKHIVAMTGSYFRGDTEAVLHPEDEAKFESVTYTYYEQLQQDLDSGFRKTLKYQDNGEIKKGDFFIVEGQKAYVADWGEQFISSYNKPDRRLRVIYDNGTESDLLLRSMQRALNRDETSRRVTNPTLGPLFSDQEEADDKTVGYVYVLRSKSENKFIAENRKVIHKIGITKGSVKKRIANAAKDPTYLLAAVDIVETYKVSNLNLTKLEKLLHKFFDPARLDLQLKDRFGFDVEPKEWFLVPLPVIEEAIQKLIDGTLPDFRYDPEEGEITKN